mgnify:CR=1 FL=1
MIKINVTKVDRVPRLVVTLFGNRVVPFGNYYHSDRISSYEFPF